MKKGIQLVILLTITFAVINAQEKTPIAYFDFENSEAGYIEKTLTRGAGGSKWTHEMCKGWSSEGTANDIRETWLISPVFDLTRSENAELLIDNLEFGTPGNTQCNLYIQEAYLLNIEEEDDETFINQWGKKLTSLEKENESGDSFSGGVPEWEFSNSIDISMWGCKRVRFALQVTDQELTTASPCYWTISKMVIIGDVCDCGSPTPSVTSIDNIGNTYIRASFSTIEPCRIYWAITPKDKPIEYVEDIKANLGSDKFTQSGSFDYWSPDDGVVYIDGLEKNKEYSFFYGGGVIFPSPTDCFLSSICQTDFTTGNYTITPLIKDVIGYQAELMPNEIDLYSLTFEVKSNPVGRLYVLLTEKGINQPSVQDILESQGGFAGSNIQLIDSDVNQITIDGLSKVQSNEFTAWFVASDGNLNSPVYEFSNIATNVVPSYNNKKVKVYSENQNLTIVCPFFIGGQCMVFDTNGIRIRSKKITSSQCSFIDLKSGIYIIIVEKNGIKVIKKVVVI